MSKITERGRSSYSSTTHVSVKPASRDTASAKVHFAGVVITHAKLSKSVVKQQLAASGSAMKRLRPALLERGVKLRIAAGVPLYHADPSNPSRVVRKLKGKERIGTFVNGKFKPI